MTGHEHFEELAALAAGGLLSGPEHGELTAHLKTCESCRRELAEYEDILFNQFPLVNFDAEHEAPVKKSQEYKARFLDRARAEGLVLPQENVHSEAFWSRVSVFFPSFRTFAYAGAGILIFLAGLLGVRLREVQHREFARSAEVRDLQARAVAAQAHNAELEKRVQELTKSKTEAAELESQLDIEKKEYTALSLHYTALEEELKSSVQHIESLRAQNNAANDRESDLSNKLKETEASLVSMTGELQNLRKARATEAASAASANDRLSHVKQMETELADANESMDRAKKLLAADHDIRDLMGARNLHITDVYDVDLRGRTKKPFGRVFYTENKSLIFYAFDLNKQKNASADRTFQVWGYQEAGLRSAQSLGILFQDDQKQNRWVLKFNDPAVLAAIDAVFVTAEPPGGSQKPTGEKLLYAYLNSKANHP